MRIIVMSDSHGNMTAVSKVFERTAYTANVYVHLGDGEKELEMIRRLYPRFDIRSVAGNCDYGSLSPDMDIIEAGDVKVLITHGHNHAVKYGTERLLAAAKSNGCRAVLFGHTHCRFQSYEDGIYLLNPGSCASPRDSLKPSYGFVDITPHGIITNIVDL